MGQDDLFSLISQTGGGYSFYKDARLRRITRYRYNNVPTDTGGRMYYIKNDEEIWSPTYKPVSTELDSFYCRHGMGYTIFEAEKNNITSKLTCFVPVEEKCEINLLEITNETNANKEIDIFSATEWCLWDAVDDSGNFQRNLSIGEVEVDDSVIYHKTEYRERRNHYAFYSVNHEVEGYDTARDSFLGYGRDWANPQTVMDGKSNDSIAYGWAPVASHHVKLVLEPGESKSLVFILGYVELPVDDKWESLNVINKTPAKDMIKKFSTNDEVDKAFKNLSNYWDELLSSFTVDSGETKLDRMINIWNQYQNMITFNLSRSASYYESGIGRGMGFRDSCQDLLGFVHMIPHRARQRIIDIASTQKEDGSAWHQYQPLTKKGNSNIGGGFNDDPLWLVAATDAYIRETGDSGILQEQVPFDSVEGSEEPLFEHLRRSIHYIMNNLGPHKLPLIGRADWNDCLNLNTYSTDPSESFQTAANREDDDVAESVFIATMFVLYGNSYVELCKRYSQKAPFDTKEEVISIEKAIADMKVAVEEHGWDGEWFLRAYDANGDKVGSKECEEGKIYIEPQGFAAMAGIGIENGKAKKALESVEKHLNTDHGTCLLWPCYNKYHLELGEISSYPPGYKENGGIFCHANPWVSIGNAIVGNNEEAYMVYQRISPAYTEDKSHIRKTEPYVYCQMIAGKEAPTHGEGKNSWLTGTAAWNFVAVTQYLLGIYPDYQGLRINPCLPERFDKIKITRTFRGKKYNINLVRGKENKLVVEDKEIEGNIVPIIDKDVINLTYTFI